jgi:hypothetical protein
METLPGVANVLAATMIAVADGSPITEGTVNFYLLALSGPDAGKWFDADTGTWLAAKHVAAVATHKDGGHWIGSIAAAAWSEGVRYAFYPEESGGLGIAHEKDVICRRPPWGDGEILVNHDTGGTDNLRAVHQGSGLAGVTVRAYLKTEYEAHVYGLKGLAVTGDDGRWIAPMYLSAGTYIFTFARADKTTKVKEQEVT